MAAVTGCPRYCHQCPLLCLFVTGLSEELNRRRYENEIMEINASATYFSDPSSHIFSLLSKFDFFFLIR